MNILSMYLLICAVSFCTFAQALIVQTSSVLPIIAHFKKMNSGMLLIVDLMDTVLCFEEEALNSNNRALLGRFFSQAYAKIHNRKTLLRDMYTNQKLRFVDKDLVKQIKQLVARDVAALGIMRNKLVDSLPILRDNSITFHSPKVFFHNKSVRFIEGVAIINGAYRNLTDSFETCIKKAAPTEIVVISADRKFIEFVRRICFNLNIKFVGYEYTAIKTRDPMDQEEAFRKLSALKKPLNEKPLNKSVIKAPLLG